MPALTRREIDNPNYLDIVLSIVQYPKLVGFSGRQERTMPFTIGFGMRNKLEIATAEKPTAKEALALVDALQRSDEEIKFIRSPHEGEIGIEMLRVLAKEDNTAHFRNGD
jgi:hypothetical protein